MWRDNRAASSLNTDGSCFVLFFKIPICYLAESIQPYSYWKLILGASSKGLLLDFLIKIQTLQGQSCCTATGDRQTQCEQLCCPAAPGQPPPCTSCSSTCSSRTSSQEREQRGQNTVSTSLATRTRGQRSWPPELHALKDGKNIIPYGHCGTRCPQTLKIQPQGYTLTPQYPCRTAPGGANSGCLL